LPRNIRGHNEDAGPDHGPGHRHGWVEQAQAPTNDGAGAAVHALSRGHPAGLRDFRQLGPLAFLEFDVDAIACSRNLLTM
jgi:hypothetical protein